MGEVIRKVKNGKVIGWYIRWRENGKRICLASKQPSAAEARKMLVQIEARIARGLAGVEIAKDRQHLTVAQLCDRFLAEFTSPRVKDLARYRRSACYGLTRVLPLVGSIQIAHLQRKDIERARDKLSQRYKPNTVRDALRPLSTALSWAVRQELIQVNPAHGAEMPRREQSLEHLTAEEAARLLAEAERQARKTMNPTHWSRWIAISLALCLGLRRGECFGLRWQDINFSLGTVTIARSYKLAPKSNKPRGLPLPSCLAPILLEWRAHCPPTDEHLVCPIIHGGRWKMSSPSAMHGLAKLLQAAGCPPLSRGFHALRHSFATAFIAQGGGLLTLRELLGHSSLNMSLVYSHVSAKSLAADLEKLNYQASGDRETTMRPPADANAPMSRIKSARGLASNEEA